MTMCRENNIDIKGFTAFAGVDSLKIETIQNAIENFESLKETYAEVIDAAALSRAKDR